MVKRKSDIQIVGVKKRVKPPAPMPDAAADASAVVPPPVKKKKKLLSRPSETITVNMPTPADLVAAQSIEHLATYPGAKVDGSASIVVLQFAPIAPEHWPIDADHDATVVDVLHCVLRMLNVSRRPGAEWLLFYATERPHVEGLSVWVGFGVGVPVYVVDVAQQVLAHYAGRIQREHAEIGRHSLRPVIAQTDHGLQTRSKLPYVVDTSRSQKMKQLHKLLLGD